MTYYGRWTYKFEEAQRQGAAGLLVLQRGGRFRMSGRSSELMCRQISPLARRQGIHGSFRHEGWLSEEACKKMFALSGLNLMRRCHVAGRNRVSRVLMKARGKVILNVKMTVGSLIMLWLFTALDKDEILGLPLSQDHLDRYDDGLSSMRFIINAPDNISPVLLTPENINRTCSSSSLIVLLAVTSRNVACGFSFS